MYGQSRCRVGDTTYFLNAIDMHATPTVLILASGKGTRFQASGATTNKLDANLAGMSVLERTISAVRDAGLRWSTVKGIDGGIGATIAAGVRENTTAIGWLILPGDLPLITPSSIQAVAQALTSHAVIVPTYDGARGHPVGFRSECGRLLSELTGDDGAKSVVQHFRQLGQVLEVPLNDDGIVQDIDTIEDLLRAEQVLLGRPVTRSIMKS